jgi:hypothetical protein
MYSIKDHDNRPSTPIIWQLTTGKWHAIRASPHRVGLPHGRIGTHDHSAAYWQQSGSTGASARFFWQADTQTRPMD